MSRLSTFLRQFLNRRGYVVTRVKPEIAPSLSSVLQYYCRLSGPTLSVVCFDNDSRFQSELLAVMPENQVLFSSPLGLPPEGKSAPGAILPNRPEGRFLTVIDLDSYSLDLLAAKLGWLHEAEVLLLRARLGSYWAGEFDFCHQSAQIKSHGFGLTDFIGHAQLSLVQQPSDSVMLVCMRRNGVCSRSEYSRYRVNEALTYLSAPIAHRGDFKLLTGRGSFGYAGGVFNPGAIVESSLTYLLPRAERTPWALQKADESRFFTSTQPLLLTLDKNNCIAKAVELNIEGLPDPTTLRAEDFRLFRFGDQIYTNHAVISYPQRRSAKHQSLQLEKMQTRIGISKLELNKPRLSWCGFLRIDRPLTQTEKNWVLIDAGDRLLMLYSFSPYILLACGHWPALDFNTIMEEPVALPFADDGLPVRNSVNPVVYDDDHWLHIVHKVYPGKQYSFWAVLLDRKSLRPVKATKRPLVRGWHSVSASIIYTCSVLADNLNIRLFSGLDDSATAVAIIPRQRLDAEWISFSPSTTSLL